MGFPWAESGTARVECLVQEHNSMSPGPPDLRALTMTMIDIYFPKLLTFISYTDFVFEGRL